MQMTFSEYDQMMEHFEKMASEAYYPDPQEYEEMEKNPDKFIKFVCFLYEKNTKPKNKEEMYSRKNMDAFIKSNLDLIDDGLVSISICASKGGSAFIGGLHEVKVEPGKMLNIEIHPDSGYFPKRIVMTDAVIGKSVIYDSDPSAEVPAPEIDAVITVYFEQVEG